MAGIGTGGGRGSTLLSSWMGARVANSVEGLSRVICSGVYLFFFSVLALTYSLLCMCACFAVLRCCCCSILFPCSGWTERR